MGRTGERTRRNDAPARLRAAGKRGLRVFGAFFAVALGFYLFTFMWFKRVDGPMELPLPVWIMLLPTLISLGAGAVAAVIVMVVDLTRDRPRRRE